MNYDVIIIGAGSGGVGSVYALKEQLSEVKADYKIAVVEINEVLGGNATAGWVDTWLQAMIPPYMEPIIRDISGLDVSTQREKYWLRGQFSKNQEDICLTLDKQELADRYMNDIQNDIHIDLYLEHCFIDAEMSEEGVVNFITIKDLNSGECKKLFGQYYIDASADGVLCRSCCPKEGQDYLCGRDSKKLFNEKSAQNGGDLQQINEASLMYQISPNVDVSELLASIQTVYPQYDANGRIISIVKPDYITTSGYPVYLKDGNVIINPMTGQSKYPYTELIGVTREESYEQYSKYMLEHWKFIKLSCQKAYENGESNYNKVYNTKLRGYGFTGKKASYLGVRETYRIICEEMMTQSDMTKLITEKTAKENKYIGESSHIIDFHISTGLSGLDDFNKKELRPHGIKYAAIIPKKMKNVLIGSRCYGASQIFLAGARGNFTIAYLGYSAGVAIALCVKRKETDVRNVNIDELQEKTQFLERVRILQSMYRNSIIGD